MNRPIEPRDRKRQRALSREEVELWREVTRSIARLRAATKPIATPTEPPAPAPEPPKKPAPARPVPTGYTPPESHSVRTPTLHPFDRRLRRDLARGHASVEGVLDLHGMRQDEAHLALRGFLATAQGRDARMVLIVTGKGLRGGSGIWPERSGGVLYRSVPHWLSSPELRRIVAGFEEADAGHGGAGALYVRLRRPTKAPSRER